VKSKQTQAAEALAEAYIQRLDDAQWTETTSVKLKDAVENYRKVRKQGRYTNNGQALGASRR
jgi:hypothetical protein